MEILAKFRVLHDLRDARNSRYSRCRQILSQTLLERGCRGSVGYELRRIDNLTLALHCFYATELLVTPVSRFYFL